MNEENKRCLDNLDNIDALKLIKNEAEMVLDECLASETIITNKANNIFQILIVMLFSLIGYLATTPKAFDLTSKVIQIAGILILCSAISIWYLLKIIYPCPSFGKGAMPERILFNDVIVEGSEEISLLKNRILNLNKSITANKKSQSKRVLHFKIATYCLLIGIIIITINLVVIICLPYQCLHLF